MGPGSDVTHSQVERVPVVFVLKLTAAALSWGATAVAVQITSFTVLLLPS